MKCKNASTSGFFLSLSFEKKEKVRIKIIYSSHPFSNTQYVKHSTPNMHYQPNSHSYSEWN